MQNLTVEQIESIKFNEMGGMFPYFLKKVEINNPMMNVHGLIQIGSNYYRKVVSEKEYKEFTSQLREPFGHQRRRDG